MRDTLPFALLCEIHGCGPQRNPEKSRRGIGRPAAGHLEAQPGSRVRPIILGSCGGYPKRLGGLGGGQSGEETQLHQLGFAGMLLLELIQGFVQPEQIVAGQGEHGRLDFRQLDPLLLATPLEAPVPPRSFDQDPPHRFGRRCEEMPLIVPLLRHGLVDQSQICFVHQRRRLQRLTGFLVRQLGGSKPTQFVIHERK